MEGEQAFPRDRQEAMFGGDASLFPSRRLFMLDGSVLELQMGFFRDLAVARKFLFAFGIVCALCSLLGAIALTGMRKMNESTTRLAEIALPSSHDLAEMNSAMQVFRRADMGIVLCDAGDCTDYYMKTRKRTSKLFDDAAEAYAATGTDAKERALFEGVREDFTSYRTASEATIRQLQGGEKAKASEQTVGANAPIFRRADASINQAMQLNTETSKQRCLEAASTFRSVRLLAAGTLLLTICLSGVIGWALTRAIAPALLRATFVLEALAQKDLTETIEATSNDEIGRLATALNTAVATVRGLLTTMQQGVETISTASVELSTCADKSALDVQRQCAMANRIATATQEMAATVGEVSQNAEHANVASQESVRTATEGGTAVREDGGPDAIDQRIYQRDGGEDVVIDAAIGRDREGGDGDPRDLRTDQPAGAECGD